VQLDERKAVLKTATNHYELNIVIFQHNSFGANRGEYCFKTEERDGYKTIALVPPPSLWVRPSEKLFPVYGV
jgi:hypothetical protein